MGECRRSEGFRPAIDLYGASRVAEEWAAGGPVRSLVGRRIKRSMHVMDGGYRKLVTG